MIAQLNEIAQIWWQWMGSMFWQVSLFIILISGLDMVIRRRVWPQVRYALWGLVFIKLIIPPTWQMPTSIVSWIQPQVEEKISVQIGVSNEAVNNTETLLLPENGKEEVIEAVTWQTWLLSGWISGIIIFSLLLIGKMMQFSKRHKKQTEVGIPEWLNELLVKTVEKLKLKKIPTIIFSGDVKSPAVYGVSKPLLILPEGYMEKLTKEQAEHVLIHELCHLKRGDLLVHWFCIILQIVYWFNPFLILARRQMRSICEICCDLSVANVLREKTGAYRETLLRTARELFVENMGPSLGFLGIFEDPFKLVPRLKWLEKRSWENRKGRITTTICISLFMVLCVMPMSGISQTSDYYSDEMNLQDDEIQGETDFTQDHIYYEILLMEANIDKEFDFSSSSATVIPGTILTFNEVLRIDGESLNDLNELIDFFQADPAVNILSFAKIIAPVGSTAELSVNGDNPDEPFVQNITITPNTINENKYIKQNIKIEVIGKNEDDPALNFKKAIENTLEVKDGKTALMLFKPGEDIYSSSGNPKKICIFFTPHIMTGNEDDITQNISKSPRMVSMDFYDVDIKVLIKFISEVTGKNFIVDQNVKGKVTVMAPSKLTIDEAYKTFESVLEVNGYTLVPSGDAIIITANPPILLDFADVDPRVVNRLITEAGGLRFIIDDAVDGKIDINTQGPMPLDEVCDLFQTILEGEGYTAVPEGDFIRITN